MTRQPFTITVYCAQERIGSYGDDEQAAINAALDYSRDTERSVVIDYNDGSYQETWERRGEWSHGPIYRERSYDGAPILVGFQREAAE